jgi:hypothetical protein
MEYTDKLTYADVEIRNTNLTERFVLNTIEQSIQHEKPILNCNLRVFDGRDDSKSRTELRKLATLAFLRNRESKWERLATDALIGNKRAGCRSVSRIRRE